jgi:tetratricopeptide (TPR) repeat protein
MDPSFQQIAELFAFPGAGEDTPQPAGPRPKEGRDADESEQLGQTCLNDGDHLAAIAHFKRAIEQRGEASVVSTLGLASAYEYADRATEAYRQYVKALKAGSEEREPRMALSDLYKRHGRFRDAIEQLESAVEKEPENAYLHFKLAETYREMGERSRALEAVINAIQAKSDESFYHYWLGDLLINMGRPDEALQALRGAIELSPGDDYLYLRAAVAFWQAGRQAEALKSVRLASDLDPEKNIYHGLLEALLSEMGQHDEADLETSRADKMDRFDHDLLARTLKEMGLETD